MTWKTDDRHAYITRPSAELLAQMRATPAERAAVERCVAVMLQRQGQSRPRGPVIAVPVPDDELAGIADERRRRLLGSAAIALATERLGRSIGEAHRAAQGYSQAPRPRTQRRKTRAA